VNADRRGVLFVCLGNICRSPTAEYVARAEFRRLGLDMPVASRGLGTWHVGCGADPRAVRVAREAGYDLSPHRAVQFRDEDFHQYSRILAVDYATLDALLVRAPADVARPERFLVAAGLAPPDAGEEGDVYDPYTGGLEDFRAVLDLTRRGVMGLGLALLDVPAMTARRGPER
jgi:low molecular weight protein-tyrosine phosphatase